jgi:hypothetical protein
MKIKCPVCGRAGHLQVRGNSKRVGHYRGIEGKKRIVEWHKFGNQVMEKMVIKGTKALVINNPNLGSNKEFVARDVGLEPTRPFDHRLSRPAPYQAWGIPHAR